MATNKHAVIRYKALDKCFRNTGRNYTIDDLQDAVNEALAEFDSTTDGIQRRQLRDDIAFMRREDGYDAPIETLRDGKGYIYRYSDKKFSINNSPLNATEAEQLKSALSVLQRFEGAPQFEWMSEIGPMLSSELGLNKSQDKIMAYDTNIDYTGYEYITPLFNAIINKRVVSINYEPFNKPAFNVTFHPYYLKQYNNRWFVLGYNAEACIPTWNIALDRIIKIEENTLPFLESDIDWEDHFYDVIGVTVDETKPVEEIELLFTKEQSSYILTKPLHPTQKSKLNDTGELFVRLKLKPNYELETKLLSFGEKVKVLKPEYLKSRIQERIRKAFKQY